MQLQPVGKLNYGCNRCARQRYDSSQPGGFAELDGELFFSASTITGAALWKSDGARGIFNTRLPTT
jgi:hypothetical protein